MTPNQLSESLLLAVKTKKNSEQLVSQLAGLRLANLTVDLNSDHRKKAFWINCYNAFFQLLSAEGKSKPQIYKQRLITIAQNKFSLDHIEHGIIRRYRFKYSFGFLPNLFASTLIKKLAVDNIDYRIHFALNCGAKSCPPIAFYSADKIERQLQLATEAFLESDSKFDLDKKELHVSKLFQWYHHDFGGKSGIRKIHTDLFNKDFKDFAIKYNTYSWELQLENYSPVDR